MTKAEQFCKLNGIEFSIKINSFECPYCGSESFTDAKSILEAMNKREDFGFFLPKVAIVATNNCSGVAEVFIHISYILNPEKLLDEAIKFCSEN